MYVNGEVSLTGSNATVIDVFNALAITDTAVKTFTLTQTQIDLFAKATSIELWTTNTHNQAITFYLLTGTKDIAIAGSGGTLSIPASGVSSRWQVYTKDEWGPLKAKMFAILSLNVTASVAPTSGSLSIKLVLKYN